MFFFLSGEYVNKSCWIDLLHLDKAYVTAGTQRANIYIASICSSKNFMQLVKLVVWTKSLFGIDNVSTKISYFPLRSYWSNYSWKSLFISFSISNPRHVISFAFVLLSYIYFVCFWAFGKDICFSTWPLCFSVSSLPGVTYGLLVQSS